MNLRFTCQPGCTNCCDQSGYVYLSEDDIPRAAEFVGMSPAAFEARYIYRTRHQRRFRKPKTKQCPFLETGGTAPPRPSQGTELTAGSAAPGSVVPLKSGRCSIHPAKPTQCRTFPFWPELVEDRDEWNRTGRFCPGIGKGELIQIGSAMEIAEEQRRAYPEQYK